MLKALAQLKTSPRQNFRQNTSHLYVFIYKQSRLKQTGLGSKFKSPESLKLLKNKLSTKEIVIATSLTLIENGKWITIEAHNLAEIVFPCTIINKVILSFHRLIYIMTFKTTD